MRGSVNQSWSISDDAINRYGKLWASLDFFINDNVYERKFELSPMDVVVGNLQLDGKEYPMTYKKLLSESSGLDFIISTKFQLKSDPEEVHSINILDKTFRLNRKEIMKLADT